MGASQALYLSLLTLIQPGDEVVMFSPYFDLYAKQIAQVGGVAKTVPLEYDRGRWIMNTGAFRAALTSKTKVVMLNSPHNPTGKVFTRQEMESIASAIEGRDVVVLSDEVYKYIVHSPPPSIPGSQNSSVQGHTHFASLPGMFSKTITISSAGKTFSATGWQDGLARALPQADLPFTRDGSDKSYASYYECLREEYVVKRDVLASALEKAGFEVPDYSEVEGGGFFVFARITPEVLKRVE